jgi:hypothetical protein
MSGRNLSAAMLAAITAQNIRTFTLLYIGFSTEICMTDYPATIAFNGRNYLPGTGLLSTPTIQETIDTKINEMSVEISGANLSNVSVALNESYIDKTIIMYRGLMNSSFQVVANPAIIFEGRITNFDFDENPEDGTAMIVWTAANNFGDFERRSGRRTNDEVQQALFPGDKGFEFCSQIIKDLKWGRA